MELVEGYDHQQGRHCGAAALRNVTAYYGLGYTEAACFGIGGGAAFVLYDHPEEPWVSFRASPPWLERAFLERLGVPHTFREGDDVETAWGNVAGHVDEDDPVIVFLDPAQMEYLPDGPAHLPPHVAVVVGYDDETVQLSDGAVASRQEIPHGTFREAWRSDRLLPLDAEYLVVTRARTTEDGTDAAAAGLRQAATYMLDPLDIKRDARGPGEEGVAALRSFGDYLGTWAELPDAARPLAAARRSIDEHGEGAAFRGLFAESLGELGRRTGLPQSLADRMDGVAREWTTVADRLEGIAAREDPLPGAFAEVGSLVADIADREAAAFRTLHEELGGHRE